MGLGPVKNLNDFSDKLAHDKPLHIYLSVLHISCVVKLSVLTSGCVGEKAIDKSSEDEIEFLIGEKDSVSHKQSILCILLLTIYNTMTWLHSHSLPLK